MLSNYLSSDSIVVGVEADDWEMAIEVASKPLLDSGKISQGYVDQMVKNVHSLGPYIVVAPNIALAHSRPSIHVFDECVSIAIFNTPVIFHNEDNDPVKIVFVFAAKENDSHIDLIRNISEILSDESTINSLLFAKDKKAVIDLLNI